LNGIVPAKKAEILARNDDWLTTPQIRLSKKKSYSKAPHHIMSILQTSPPSLTTSELDELKQIVSPDYKWLHEQVSNLDDEVSSDGILLSLNDMNTILLRAAIRIKRKEQDGEHTLQLAKEQTVQPSEVNLPQAYMDSSKAVMKPDGKELVSSETRRLADKGRIITDHIRTKVKKESKLTKTFYTVYIMMKSIPIFTLKWIAVPSWVLFHITESFIIIVTLTFITQPCFCPSDRFERLELTET
jgi:hypothetical protein